MYLVFNLSFVSGNCLNGNDVYGWTSNGITYIFTHFLLFRNFEAAFSLGIMKSFYLNERWNKKRRKSTILFLFWHCCDDQGTEATKANYSLQIVPKNLDIFFSSFIIKRWWTHSNTVLFREFRVLNFQTEKFCFFFQYHFKCNRFL